MELSSIDLENDFDWYVWRFYMDAVVTDSDTDSILIRTLIKELHYKLEEQSATLCKGKLNDRVFEYREKKQVLLHNVDLMLDLTKEDS